MYLFRPVHYNFFSKRFSLGQVFFLLYFFVLRYPITFLIVYPLLFNNELVMLVMKKLHVIIKTYN